MSSFIFSVPSLKLEQSFDAARKRPLRMNAALKYHLISTRELLGKEKQIRVSVQVNRVFRILYFGYSFGGKNL